MGSPGQSTSESQRNNRNKSGEAPGNAVKEDGFLEAGLPTSKRNGHSSRTKVLTANDVYNVLDKLYSKVNRQPNRRDSIEKVGANLGFVEVGRKYRVTMIEEGKKQSEEDARKMIPCNVTKTIEGELLGFSFPEGTQLVHLVLREGKRKRHEVCFESYGYEKIASKFSQESDGNSLVFYRAGGQECFRIESLRGSTTKA